MVRDMTKGSPLRHIIGFFFPLLLGNLFQQVYSMADSVIVGRFVGVKAFAGISATGSLNFLIIGLLLGMCSGCAIPVAHAFGEGNPEKTRKCFANAIYLCGGLALLLSAGTALSARQILRLINTPADIMNESYNYIVIIFAGMTATMLYNLASGMLRAVGNTRTPLFFLVLSCGVNIALDLLFVVTFGMGVRGAAIATILAQLLSGVLCMAVIFRRYDVLCIRGGEWQPDPSILRELCGMGLPMGLQFSITAVGSLIIQTAVNGLGSTAVAAIGTGAKIQFIFCCPFDAIGATIATWCGQNTGARQMDRAREGVRLSMIIMLLYSMAALFAVRVAGEPLARLFISGSETGIIAAALQYLRMITWFFPALLGVYVFRNALQGMGKSRVAMFAGLFELVGRATVATLLVGPYGFSGAILANPAAWILANLLLIPAYIRTIHQMQCS